ncbi:MAG: Fe-S cluster assembly protein SufD [Deltaproteobacteria bacterium]|nr:Fe-S cluster assembly protein SufD [Deltaproteobacteria bacterium]
MQSPISETTRETVEAWSRQHHEPAWLTDQRGRAWEASQHFPAPPKTAEAWKYTDLEKIGGWHAAIWPSPPPSPTVEGAACALAGEGVTQPPPGNEGVIFCDLRSALQTHGDLVRPYLADAAQRSSFSSVGNTVYGGLRYLSQQEALWDRGFFLYVPRGISITQPLHATVTCATAGSAIFPRTIVVVEEDASITYVEEYFANTPLDTAATSCHARSEFFLKPGSRCHYVNIQRWPSGMYHLAHQHATIARNAHFATVGITLGGSVAKTVTESRLMAPGAESLLFGLTFADGTQHVDHHTIQTHEATNTMSNLLFKAALKGDAKAIFTGLIRMTEAAQQGTAYQASRNLLLSERCQANAIPQLEIAANDVKCSHGATMGPIDREQLYYLTARGLSPDQATQMIAAGFFEEILARVPARDMMEIVRQAIHEKLEG